MTRLTIDKIMQNRREWAEYLIVNKDKQGQDALRNHDGKFCCLGMYCEMRDPEQWVLDIEFDDPLYNEDIPGIPYRVFSDIYDDGVAYVQGDLPEKFQAELGINTPIHNHLQQMNDGTGPFNDNAQSFEQIAAFVLALPALDYYSDSYAVWTP